MSYVARKTSRALIGVILILLGLVAYLIGAAAGVLRVILSNDYIEKVWIEWILWYSALPIIVGLGLFLSSLYVVGKKRSERSLRDTNLENEKITVALTAYNDELSISAAVRDFILHPNVTRVIVVSNNSTDNTEKFAAEAGAIVISEGTQGYGACVKRAITEAAAYPDTAIVALCEGDMTFRAYDLSKMVPYLKHADIVNGTRIVEALQERETQVTLFMHYGNLAVAKLLELKYFGDATLTDVGTTYKIFRREKALELLPKIHLGINLEFNPYLIETAIKNKFKFLEVPITFHQRLGVSKGGNISNKVAFRVGVRMIKGIIFGWAKII